MEIFTKKYLECLEEILKFKDLFIYNRESGKTRDAMLKRDELRRICRRRLIKFNA